MANKMEEKSQKMTLRGYYRALPEATHPKSDFITRIQSECGVSFTTARNWVMGVTKPYNPEHVKKLSEMTGIKPENLWTN